MLPQRGLKNRRRQVAKMKRIEIPERHEPRLVLPLLAGADLTTGGRSLQLHFCFKFGQRRNDHLIFGIYGAAHIRSLRLFAQQFQEATVCQT